MRYIAYFVYSRFEGRLINTCIRLYFVETDSWMMGFAEPLSGDYSMRLSFENTCEKIVCMELVVKYSHADIDDVELFLHRC